MSNKSITAYRKKKLNTKLQITILQTTKKPFTFSLTKVFIGVFLFSFIAYICFSCFVFFENKQLKEVVQNKNNEVSSLNSEISSLTSENTDLKSTIIQKDEIIEEKIVEIENEIEQIDNYKQAINNFLNGGQVLSSNTSRSLYSRAQAEETQGIQSNQLNLSLIEFDSKYSEINDNNKHEIFSDLDFIKTTLEEYSSNLIDSKETMIVLEEKVETRVDYLERVPNLTPTEGRITSNYGYRRNPVSYRYEFHHGLDISNNYGTKILAAGRGEVTEIGYDYLFGKYIIINHGYDFATRYAHLSKINLSVGDKVEKGQQIGTMGNTGQSTGPHLHFEIIVDGVRIDPLKIEDYYE